MAFSEASLILVPHELVVSHSLPIARPELEFFIEDACHVTFIARCPFQKVESGERNGAARLSASFQLLDELPGDS